MPPFQRGSEPGDIHRQSLARSTSCLRARKPGDFLVSIGGCTDERKIAVFGQDDQIVTGKEDLAIPISAALPLDLTGFGVHSGKDPFVEAVDHPVAQDRSGESILHPVVAPDLSHRETLAVSAQLHHGTASAVTCRDEHAVVADDEWLRRVDPVVGREWIFPQHLPVTRHEAHHSCRADDQKLPHTIERHQHRRSVRLLVTERRPGALPGVPVVANDRLAHWYHQAGRSPCHRQ